MADPKKQQKKGASRIENLPNKSTTTDKSAQVKGGAISRGGNDDLEDLEVER